MASRTQLRLQQITGSAIDIKTEASNYIVQSTAATLTGSDMQDLFGMVGAALNRIHGAASDEPFNSPEGTFATTVFDVNASGAVTVDSSGGTISIGADNVSQNINIGTDGVREITIGDASAANAAGLTLRANTGGIDIDCSQSTGALSLDTAGGAIEIGVNAAAGAINIGTNATQRKVTIGSSTGNTEVEIATGTGGVDVDSTGKINIATSNANADALTIDVSGNGGADITVGNAANDANANLDLVVMNKLNIDAQGTDADDGVEITLGADNGSVKFVVQNNSGNDGLTVDGLRDVEVGRNLTIGGDLTVNGSTVTLDTTNLNVKDPFIFTNDGVQALNSNTGIVFASGSAQAARPDVVFGRVANDTWGLGTIAGTSGSLTNASGMTTTDMALRLNKLELADATAHIEVTGNVLTITDNAAIELVTGGSGDIVLDAGGDVVIDGTSQKLEFGSAGSGEHIVGDGNDLTIASGRDIILDAASSVSLSYDGGPGTFFAIKNGNTQVGHISGSLSGDAKGLILSASNQGSITLDSGNGFISFSKAGLGNDFMQIIKEGANVNLGAGSNADLIFVHDILDANPGETFRIDKSVNALAFPQQDATGSKLDSNEVRVGLLSFNGTTDVNEAIYGDGSRLYLRSNAVNFKMPTAVGSSNQVLADTGGDGTLGFIDVAAASNISRVNMVIAQAVASGSALDPNSASVSNTAPSSRADLNLSGVTNANLPNHVDVFVNGQLLLSGSDANVGAGTADYFVNVHSADSRIKFAFGLEIDDIVSILRKA